MKAFIATQYGPPDVFRMINIKTPTPGDDEVLIKVHAASVTMGDCEIRRFNIPVLFWLPLRLYIGIFKPRLNILGQELAGVVEDTGRNVTRFKKDDEVFGSSDMRHGAYAQYNVAPANYLSVRPSNMKLEEAVTLPLGGLNALYLLNKVKISAGQKILILGAAGSIGVIAVQITKSLGAEVTGVDAAHKLKMLMSIGADHVIDFTTEDFTTSNIKYDHIFDIAGKSTFLPGIKNLKSGGCFIMANLHPLHMLHALWIRITSNIKIVMGAAPYTPETLAQLTALAESGTIKAIIDKQFSFEQLPEAHAYVDKGLKIGNVTIKISD